MRGIFILSWSNSMLLKTWCTFIFFFLWFHFFIYRGKDSHYLYPCVFCTKRTKPKERRKLDGDYNKHIRKYLFKNFTIKVKEGDVICGACRLRNYKCRPCSDRQATCEHYVVSDDKDYQPPTKKGKEPMKSPKQIPLLLSSDKGSNVTHSVVYVNVEGTSLLSFHQ